MIECNGRFGGRVGYDSSTIPTLQLHLRHFTRRVQDEGIPGFYCGPAFLDRIRGLLYLYRRYGGHPTRRSSRTFSDSNLALFKSFS